MGAWSSGALLSRRKDACSVVQQAARRLPSSDTTASHRRRLHARVQPHLSCTLAGLLQRVQRVQAACRCAAEAWLHPGTQPVPGRGCRVRGRQPSGSLLHSRTSVRPAAQSCRQRAERARTLDMKVAESSAESMMPVLEASGQGSTPFRRLRSNLLSAQARPFRSVECSVHATTCCCSPHPGMHRRPAEPNAAMQRYVRAASWSALYRPSCAAVLVREGIVQVGGLAPLAAHPLLRVRDVQPFVSWLCASLRRLPEAG